MADANFSKNVLPEFEVTLKDNQIVDLKMPKGFALGEEVYAIQFTGNDWTGELQDGDFVFADPSELPVTDDYVVIWAKGISTPALEKMALSFMPGSIGSAIHPESNAIPMLSIARPGGYVRTVPCHKLEKVHKIIGKARAQAMEVA